METKTFERQLLSMKAELESSIARLLEENDAVATSDDGVDLNDEASLEIESRNEAALLRQQQHELDEVNHALTKIAEGTYGICEASGDVIPEARLRAMPHTRYCIEDQRKAEA